MLVSWGTGRRGPIAPEAGTGTFRTVELSAPVIVDRKKLTSTTVVRVNSRHGDGGGLGILGLEVVVHRTAADRAVRGCDQHVLGLIRRLNRIDGGVDCLRN